MARRRQDRRFPGRWDGRVAYWVSITGVVARKDQQMFADFLDFLPGFMTEWWFLGTMIVVLLGLVGLMIFLRNQRPED
jgi:hypothetical protein